MITGLHGIIFSPDAEAVRSLLGDVLGFPSVDAGGGWRIYATPPAELAAHPSEGGGQELHLMCDDIEATVAELRGLGGCGASYSGPVRCLRVSGSNASLVMTITSQEGLAPKWKGAVYWLHQSADGTTDGQRNSLLTQQQLDGAYASCPDPGAPLKGSFNTIATTGAVTIIVDGPQTAV